MTQKDNSLQLPNNRGFTLIEILLVLGIVTTLSVIFIVAINPAKESARSRNNQRELGVRIMLDAVYKNKLDSRGDFDCAAGSIPTASSSSMATSTYDIAPCLIPAYLNNLPNDPEDSAAYYSSTTDYNTGYYIIKNITTGRITISAPSAELGKIISVTR